MKIQNLIALVSTIIGLILIITFTIIKYEPINRSKYFIIKNKDKIKYVKDGDYSHYSIDSLKGYYTDVSINLKSDSSYTVIFWGDRNSWLWDFKLDNYFTVDVPYNRYKGKDVEKDIEIINILKNIK